MCPKVNELYMTKNNDYYKKRKKDINTLHQCLYNFLTNIKRD